MSYTDCPADYRTYFDDTSLWDWLYDYLTYYPGYPYYKDYSIPAKPLIYSQGLTKSALEYVTELGICGWYYTWDGSDKS